MAQTIEFPVGESNGSATLDLVVLTPHTNTVLETITGITPAATRPNDPVTGVASYSSDSAGLVRLVATRQSDGLVSFAGFAYLPGVASSTTRAEVSEALARMNALYSIPTGQAALPYTSFRIMDVIRYIMKYMSVPIKADADSVDVYNAAGSSIEQTYDLADDGTTFSSGVVEAGS